MYESVSGVFLSLPTSIFFINGSGTDLYEEGKAHYNATCVAGSIATNGNADGPLRNGALFHNPGRMKYDVTSNSLFVMSDSGNTIRYLDFNTGMVTTLRYPSGNVISFDVPEGYSRGGRYPGMAIDISESTLYVADRRNVFNLTTASTPALPHAYSRHQYTALSKFAASQSWPSTYYIFGLVVVRSEGMIYVTVSMSVNVLLRIPMTLSHFSEITVVAGDSSRIYGGVFIDYSTPYARDGFGSDALLAFPSSLTYDPIGHNLYFSECFTEFDDQIDDMYVGSMTIRRYSLRTGYVSFYAGVDFSNMDNPTHDMYFTSGGYRDGWGGTAQFSYPLTLSYAYSQLNAPVLFVSDFFNNAVRVVYTAIGNVPTTKSATPTIFPTLVPTSSLPTLIPTGEPSASPTVDYRFVNVSTVITRSSIVGVAPGMYESVSGVFLSLPTSIFFINGSGTDLYEEGKAHYNATCVAGSIATNGNADGPLRNGALFHNPGRMKYDVTSNSLFVMSDSGNTIRYLDFNTGMVTTLRYPSGNVISFDVPEGYSRGGRYPGMAIDISESTLYVADRRNVFNLTTASTPALPHAYSRHQYTALSKFAASQSWPSTYYIFGLVVVRSEGMIYVTVSMSVNVLLRIPMTLSHFSEITVVAGDSSRIYGGVFIDYSTPYARDGFGSDALLAFPSSLTYDPIGHNLYFSECFTEFDDQIDDMYVGSMTIRRYSLRTGYVSFYAGVDFSNMDNPTHDMYFTSGGYRDGWGGTAQFSYPLTLSYAYSQLNAPVLFVSDFFNNAVRVVYTAIGNVPTTKSATPTIFPTSVLNSRDTTSRLSTSGFSREKYVNLFMYASVAEMTEENTVSSPKFNASVNLSTVERYHEFISVCVSKNPYAPTVFPSSPPTVTPPAIIYDFDDSESRVLSSIYGEERSCEVAYTESFWYGEQRVGGMGAWKILLHEFKARNSSAFDIATASLRSAGASCSNCTQPHSFDNAIVCNDRIALRTIYHALLNAANATVECNGSAWKMATCSTGVVALCVDCASPCGCEETSTSLQNAPLPTDKPCYASGGVVSALCFSFERVRPPPSFDRISPNPASYSSSSHSLDVVVFNVTGPCYIYCAAFTQSEMQQVNTLGPIRAGAIPVVGDRGNVVVRVDGIYPDISYTFLCFTESLHSIYPTGPQSSSLTTAFSKAASIVISQRKYASVSLTGQYRVFVEDLVGPFNVTISATPLTVVTMVPVAYMRTPDTNGDCDPEGLTARDVESSNISFSSSAVNFTAATPTSAVFFLSGSSPGCAYVVVSMTGASSSEYGHSTNVSAPYVTSVGTVRQRTTRAIILKILPREVPVSPPKLLSAEFTQFGDGALIAFDSATDMGIQAGLIAGQAFTCADIFRFTGAALSTCLFFSMSSVQVTFPVTFDGGLSLPHVGDEISLEANKIKAACPSGAANSICATYEYASTSSGIQFLPPNHVKQPVVTITGPELVSLCDNITLDYESSSGHGGRAWAVESWSVFDGTGSLNEQATDYINSAKSKTLCGVSGNYRCVLLPVAYLGDELTTFVLSLSNWLGASSTGSVSVNRRAGGTTPIIVFHEGRLLHMGRNDALYLSPSVSQAIPCAGSSGITTPRYIFEWRMFRGDDRVRTNVVNMATQTSIFFLRPYTLLANTLYTVDLFVTDISSSSVSSSSVRILVSSGGVIARFRGGITRMSISPSSSFELDASASVEEDVNSAGGEQNSLSFRWACAASTVSAAASCATLSSTLNGAQYAKPVISIPASSLMALSIFWIKVVVRNAAGLQDTATIEIVTVANGSSVPSIQIDMSQSGDDPSDNIVNAADQLMLQASTYYLSRFVVSWSIAVPQLELLRYLDYTVPLGGFVSLPHRIVGGLLSAGLTYTFQMKSTPYDCGTSPCSSSYSELTVEVNHPPDLGMFEVVPTMGVGGYGNTLFAMRLSSCYDQNVPLNFQFSFTDFNTDRAIALSAWSRSPNLASHLSFGRQGDRILTVQGSVRDALGAVSVESLGVQVRTTISMTRAQLTRLVQSATVEARFVSNFPLFLQRCVVASAFLSESHNLSLSDTTPTESIRFIADVTATTIENATLAVQRLGSFIFPYEMSQFQTAVNLCFSFLETKSVKMGDAPSVAALRQYVQALVDQYVDSSATESVTLATDLLQCWDAALSSGSRMSVTEGRRRQLQAQAGDSANLPYSLLRILRDDVVLGETFSQSLENVKYSVEVGWPFTLSSNPIFGDLPNKDLATLLTNFSSVANSFELTAASKYVADVSSQRNVAVDPNCVVDSDTCAFIGLSDTSVSSFAITTSVLQNLTAMATLPVEVSLRTRNITDRIGGQDLSLFSLRCDGEAVASQKHYTCFSNMTNAIAVPVEVECGVNMRGMWEGVCPGYVSQPTCGDATGSESAACELVKWTELTTVCVCPSSVSDAPSPEGRGEITVTFEVTNAAMLASFLSSDLSTNFVMDSPTIQPTVLRQKASSTDNNDVNMRTFTILFPLCLLCCVCIMFLLIVLFRKYNNNEKSRLMQLYLPSEPPTNISLYRQRVESARKNVEDEKLEEALVDYFTAVRIIDEIHEDELEENRDDGSAAGSNSSVSRSISSRKPGLDPVDEARTYYEIAEVLTALDRQNEAREFYQKALALFQHPMDSLWFSSPFGLDPLEDTYHGPMSMEEMRAQIQRELRAASELQMAMEFHSSVDSSEGDDSNSEDSGPANSTDSGSWISGLVALEATAPSLISYESETRSRNSHGGLDRTKGLADDSEKSIKSPDRSVGTLSSRGSVPVIHESASNRGGVVLLTPEETGIWGDDEEELYHRRTSDFTFQDAGFDSGGNMEPLVSMIDSNVVRTAESDFSFDDAGFDRGEEVVPHQLEPVFQQEAALSHATSDFTFNDAGFSSDEDIEQVHSPHWTQLKLVDRDAGVKTVRISEVLAIDTSSPHMEDADTGGGAAMSSNDFSAPEEDDYSDDSSVVA